MFWSIKILLKYLISLSLEDFASLLYLHMVFRHSVQEYVGKPSETDSIKSKISSKTVRGEKDITKRHHHRHHQRQPDEQQFPYTGGLR